MFPRLSAQRIRHEPGSVVKPCSSQGDYEELQNINITIDTYRERNFVKLRERGGSSVYIFISRVQNIFFFGFLKSASNI